MLDLKNFQAAISQISDEKNISKEKVIETIEQAIAAAYKKEYSNKNAIIKSKIDPSTGEAKFWQVKLVVDEDMIKSEEEEEEKEEGEEKKKEVEKKGDSKDEGEGDEGEEDKRVKFSEERHIMIDEAKKINPDVEVEGEIIFPLEIQEDFGRIAAQTAKQVILQRLREAERDAIMEDFKDKEGEIVSGLVQRFEKRNVFVNLGRAQGVMFSNESIPGERYRIGDRLKFYIMAIQEGHKGPMIVLSRKHPNFIKKLFELEVPEISMGSVEIMSIAREAGFRTKIAVHSTVEGVDPIGSCVGQKGTRVMAILNELGQEKIDIIKWSEDPEEFVASSLSPAKVSKSKMGERRNILAFVPEDQLSLAIGKDGQNVRLAAKLTGWKIDVRNESNPDEKIAGGIADIPSSDEASEEESTSEQDNNEDE